MQQITRISTLLLLTTLLLSCDSKDWESAGYQDGYAATVNTVCGFRATLVHGKYDNPKYAKGYAQGANAATVDVQRKGCESFR
jgi:hypothetical protein